MSKGDTMQLILYGNPNSFKSYFSTQFTPKSEITYSFITSKCNQFLNSNEHFTINKDMMLDIKVIKVTGGAGINLRDIKIF